MQRISNSKILIIHYLPFKKLTNKEDKEQEQSIEGKGERTTQDSQKAATLQ